MTRYLTRRVLQTIPILFVITILQFTLIQAAPGGPLRAYLENPEASLEDIQRLEQELGLNDPLPLRYVKWLGALLRGDLGRSYFTHRPVLEMIGERIPATLVLNLAALLISYLIGIPMGIYAGLYRGGWIDHFVRFFTSILNAVPHWWIGLLCIIGIANFKLATGVQLFPTGGMYTLGREGFGALDRLWHLLLPALMLGTGGWVGFARFLRSETLEVLGNDYVRTAHAKGLSQRVVTYRHILRNALIPVVTLSAGVLTVFIAGAVIYENIFSWPGMGRLTFEATLKKDYPVSLGVLFISTVLVITGRLLADIAYGWVDPRIKYE
jgi:peptide/nickel transport system permease protein